MLARVRQVLSGLRPRLPSDYESLVDSLSPEAQAAFASLPVYDRAHLCAVYRRLRKQGETDPDLLAAALLHDLGKAAEGDRVRLTDRVAYVLLARLAPRLLERLSRLPAPGWRRGLALAAHHPMLGAEWARELGCNERVGWLIAHHADEPPPADDELRRLIAADRAG